MISVGPLKLRNPVVLAACPLGGSPETLRAAYDAGAGAVVTKSVTLEPRAGSPEPNVAELSGCWTLNWVGLANPGAAEFARMLGRPDYPVIVSLAGDSPVDFGAMAGMFDGAAGFEINVSCPNAAGVCEVGSDPELTAGAVRAVRQSTGLPVFVKVGYGMFGAVGAAIGAGADGITAINTLHGIGMCAENRNSARLGGLSGPGLLPVGLRMVRHISAKYGIPVMGCGGVFTARDAADYIMVGAAAVQVGTAVMRDVSVLGRVAAGLASRGQ